MHPILARGRLRLYLAAWVPAGGLLAAIAGPASGRGWGEALALTVPLALIYAFICLGSWSLCKALPLERTGFPRLAAAIGAAAAVSSALWLVFGLGWASALGRLLRDPGTVGRFKGDLPLFFAIGALLFALAAAVHYLLIAFEASREAERNALELQVLAREAQLKELKAQINPHFLFNSLNSISALAGSDPAGARRMCLLLADFLRSSLGLGAKDQIPLAEEMALVERFLAVEQVRFGQRLQVERLIEPQAAACLVPALVLQPLIENAVNHGIAHLVAGGTVRIEGRAEAGRLRIAVENPCDPDRPSGRGSGLGLANVRARLAAVHGADSRVDIREEGDRFRVALSLPALLEKRGGSGPSFTPGVTEAIDRQASAERASP